MKRIYLLSIVLLIALLSGMKQTVVAQTTTYSAAGAYTYTVPAGCTGVLCNVCGAQGGVAWATGGKGGCVQANVAVTPGQLLYVYVGGQGQAYPTCTGGSSSGGEQGGSGGTSDGGSGGGAGSDIRNSITGGATSAGSLNSRILVGGGGGGDSYDCGYNAGGSGGYPAGAGGGGSCGCTNTTGGSQSAGGSAQSCGYTNGAYGNGGAGTFFGGGGGGGWYGGGGGYEGSGGGGSSTAQTVGINVPTSITYTNNTQTGAGLVTILPLVPTVTPTPASLAFGPVLVGTSALPPLFTTLSGAYMGAGPLTITVPAGSGFTIATDANPVFGTSQTLAYTPPVFSGLNIYVNFNPLLVTTYSSVITVSGGGLGTPVSIPVSGSGVNSCTGTPSGGISIATPSTGSIYTPFTLSISPAPTAGGFTYQWQSSPTGSAPWTNISGAVLSTYSFTGVTTSMFYQCVVTCTASGLSTTFGGAHITAAGLAATGCTPTAAAGYCCGFSIGEPSPNAFTMSGNLGALTDATPTSGTVLYHDFTGSYNVTESPGSSPTVSIGGSSAPNPMSVQFWIDFNNDGTFQSTESIGGGAIPASTVAHPPITIPATAAPGVYRMRVVLVFATGNPNYPSIPPCPTTAISQADTRDYTVIIAPPVCSGTPGAGIVAATANSACTPATFTPTLFDVGASNASGITYNWQTSPDGSSWTNIGGASNTIFTPTVTTVGVVYFRNSVACSGGGTGYTPAIAVSLNPSPTPITPSPANLCTGVPTTLTSTPVGGNWTSGNTAVATTAGTTSGAVTGVAIGVANITYTLPTGCYTSAQVTVNSQPNAIVGAATACVGANNNYTDATPGGTWSSSTTTVGTINSASGIFTAAAAGTTSVSYASIYGCVTSMTVTVNPLPGLFIVGGGGPYCIGSPAPWHVTLSGSTAGITYQLLLNGSASGLPSLPGGTGSLDFGIQSAPGTYTVLATNNVTGCSRLMVSSAIITINPLPLQFTVSGGGSYCAGALGSAPHITISGTQSGVNYKLYNGTSLISTIAGSGSTLDFGAQTLAGCYTVVAQNATTGCTNNMLGGACVTINPPPAGFNVLPPGGAGFCLGGAGVDVSLSFSNTGISYQLFNGSTLVGTLPGTGSPLDFGVQATAGTYTITGTNVTTGCSASMLGAATISVNNPPPTHNVQTNTGANSGSYCAGGAGVDIQIDASDGGVNYQLYNGVIPVGVPLGGTGLSLDFGYQTGAGVYTVVATDATTLCTSNMVGSVTISINPLPPLATVTGGGNFCVGGPGVHIGLNPSTAGISYQLIASGVPVGTPIVGTGGPIDFGVYSALGIYTVQATNTVTGCSRNMTGVATISTNPLPTQFNVTGTGSYCSGTSGINVGLDFSATGITYQLYRGTTPVGTPVSGTGAPISFGYQTIAGTYTVVGTNVSTSCTNNMAGSAVISVNPLPALHLATGGGNFCAGDTGRHVGLNGSEAGISYQLFVGLTPVGSPLTGTGSLLDFGLQTIAGTYAIVALNPVTGCSRYMTGGIPINVYPLPDVFSVTGGGLYCAGTPGVHIGLSGSVVGVKYQLYNTGVPVGLPISGTSTAIDFGLQLAAGTYTVVATNATTNCTNNMSGSVIVGTSPLPSVFTVTGGGNYCIGGAGSTVGLDGSDVSVNYQLYYGPSMIGAPVPGTGAAISFGAFTGSGTYTVVATNAVTGCVNNMMGSAVIGINPLPATYTVTGGGNYCAGGTGYHIYLAGSSTGVSYQLYNGTTSVGSAISGTGSAIDLGLHTDAGNYTVLATNNTTTCSRNMTGSASINIYPLPTVHNVTGGGGYCAGGTGVNIGLDTSNFGILYQLYQGSIPVGLPVPGTGSNINFGLHTNVAAYTVVAINNATTCLNNMAGSATVSVLPLPSVFPVTGGGTYCATGEGVHVYLGGSETGVKYQLWNGVSPVGAPVSGTSGTLDFGLETIVGGYTVSAVNTTTSCANNMSGTVSVSVLPNVYPHTTITSTPSGLACVGQTVHFNAAPVGGGTTPTFQWQVNGTTMGSGTSFSYIPSNGDLVIALINSNYQCAFPQVGHDTVVMNVSPPEMPSVSVAVNPGNQICTGGTATFTATTAYGGSTPDLRWIKNSVFVGSGASYSYVPNNGDIVTFMMGSNFPCRLTDTVFSNNITLSVQPAQLPVVTVSANPGGSLTEGHSVTFTATVLHGGADPMYQWVINSTPVAGATNSTYTTSSIANKDSVSCMVEGACGLVGFNSISMSVHAAGVGVANVNGNGNVLSLIPNPNKGNFTVKGTLASTADQEVTLEVVNMLGQVVYTGKVNAAGGNLNEHIQLGSVSNGMYLMNIRSGADNTVFHFVIEQ